MPVRTADLYQHFVTPNGKIASADEPSSLARAYVDACVQNMYARFTSEALDPYVRDGRKHICAQDLFSEIQAHARRKTGMCSLDRCVLVVIVDKRVHLYICRKNNTRCSNNDQEIRYVTLRKLVEKNMQGLNNDVYFFVTLGDRPCWTLRHLPHLCSSVSTQNAPHVAPMPLLAYFDSYCFTGVSRAETTYEHCKKMAAEASVEYETKANVAFFTGNFHGRHTAELRTALAKELEHTPNVIFLDSKIHANAEPFFAWGAYKFLLSVPGNEPWTDRDLCLFTLGSLVVRIPVVQVNKSGSGCVTKDCSQWIDGIFKEGQHYVSTPPVLVTGTLEPRQLVQESVTQVCDYIVKFVENVKTGVFARAEQIAREAQDVANAILLDRHMHTYYNSMIRAFAKRPPLLYDANASPISPVNLMQLATRYGWEQCSVINEHEARVVHVRRKRGCPPEKYAREHHRLVYAKVLNGS